MREHDEKDDRRFGALEGQQARMAGSLDVLVDQNAALMSAFGVRSGEDERTHKPVAMMGQREALIKGLGAVGGLLVLEKVLVAIWPYLVAALKAVSQVH